MNRPGGQESRAIDLHQGDRLDEAALRNLIRAAVALERKPPNPQSTSRSPR